ncbi:UDP-N-acetylmuramyl pentapeptide phosphotransferase/UDP-N-acetylglucosamine-1-phosphate transferase [Neisseria perflava]|uniref:hypothetical protein n=1 Tax=Neisseria perflava TaxID=33053 RepID=UPI00209D0C44|nr:hypothetical protein [Neisseria perflava]MCP1773442.1 UDP-N-acetylmuramyl pentapeptide phosphotransferase/UDP-N-acetylglucosamine-1-phosphate transferase [Neisseria perflava]
MKKAKVGLYIIPIIFCLLHIAITYWGSYAFSHATPYNSQRVINAVNFVYFSKYIVTGCLGYLFFNKQNAIYPIAIVFSVGLISIFPSVSNEYPFRSEFGVMLLYLLAATAIGYLLGFILALILHKCSIAIKNRMTAP